MRGFKVAAFAAVASLALAAPALQPAFAQQATQVAVLEGDAVGEYRALGVVTAEVHQKSLFPKVSAKQQLDDALRAEAAKLGADAVIQVKYKMGNAALSSDGQHATGVAVKFTRAPVQMAAAPTPAPVPAPPPPVQVAAAPVAPPAPAPVRAPVVVPTAPSPPVVVAAAPPAPAPAPVAAPVVATAPVIAAPAVARHATAPAMIMLSEQDIAGQPYERLGEVSAVTHQKSLFPKTPPLDQLKAALQGEAAKLGADAVIQVKYKMGNAALSSDGHKASGVAVRFTGGAAAAAPLAAPVAAPPVAVASAAPVVRAPVVASPVAAPAPAVAAPSAAATGAARHAATPAMIVLSEQDLVGQRYVRLGDVTAVTHQKSLFPKTPPLETLKAALQAEAARLGADAVILVKYKMGNAALSSDGHKATGVAVRFE